MTIQSGVSRELLDMMIADGAAFATATFKVALYDENADLNLIDPVLSSNEVTGSGYTAGGATTTVTVATNAAAQGDYGVGEFITVDFSDVSWANLTASPRAAVIYRTSNTKAVAIIDFGQTLTLVNQTLTLTFPSTSSPLNSPIVIRTNPASLG